MRTARHLLLLFVLLAVPLSAQRQLSWDALDVTARLDAAGVLDVVELQTMVFSGDWNGGERTFNIRPRQKLTFVGMERIDPSTQQRIALTEDASLDDVDGYAFTDAHTLRWRGRRRTDPPFANTRLTYALHYRLSSILLKEDERYVLDHDFAFPDRVGEIRRFALHLAFDDAWKPLSDVRESYTAGPLAPGRSFVLTIPLTYTGVGSPSAIDTKRPPPVVAGVAMILGMLVLSIAALLVREFRVGRFVPVQTDGIDANWIRQHIVSHPAEVVGAAWDGAVDKDEVSALIARLVSQHKLASHMGPSKSSLQLTLAVDRSRFDGYERALIDGLFFGGRASTTTDDIKKHYEKKGFDPAKLIQKGLLERVAELLPQGKNPHVFWWVSVLLFLAGAACLVAEGITSESSDPTPIVVGVIALVAFGVGQIPGVVFRQRIDWGLKALALSLLAPVLTALAAAWFLWSRVGTGAAEWSLWMIGALTALTSWVVYASANALKSRNHRDAIAFRKMLAAGRLFFTRELARDRPALSDDWFPWIAAFGLTNEADRWSVRHASAAHDSSGWTSGSRSSSSSGTSSAEPVWTGAGGGRSGGAGGGASWAAAVAGMAAGVAAPSSSGSGGGGGGSSGGGSSGGGGGGGW